MMNVEVDESGAVDAVALLSVARRDGRVVEQTKPHGSRSLSVVTGWTRSDKGVRDAAGHHLVDGVGTAAGRAQRGLEAARRHRGVSVDLNQAAGGRRIVKSGDIVHRMAERDGVEIGRRRVGTDQALELVACKDSLDRSQPIRPFRMARRRQMIEAGRMRYKERRHRQNLVVCGAKWKCRCTPKPSYAKATSLMLSAPSITSRSSPEEPGARCSAKNRAIAMRASGSVPARAAASASSARSAPPVAVAN